MNINEFNNNVNALSNAIIAQLPSISATITKTGLSFIHDRILNEGLPGVKYSTNKLPGFFFTGKSISDLGKDAVNSVIKKNQKSGTPGISYEEFRKANGLQTSHVDLRLTGDMWSDMDVLEGSGAGFKYITEAGSKNSITYPDGKKTGDIVGYLAERYGDFLTPTIAEERILNNSLDEELQNLIDTYL